MANEGHRRLTKAHSSQRRSTAANDGPQQPMTAHKEEKGPKRCVWRRLGPGCVFFLIIFLRFIDNNGPKRRQTRHLGRFVGSSPHQPAARHPPDPPQLPSALPPPPTTRVHPLPCAGHLTTHTSHHHHQVVASPHPTATTRHVTSPTFSNRAGKTKKG